jgi:thiol-disulfide isomerase/thioredoxin
MMRLLIGLSVLYMASAAGAQTRLSGTLVGYDDKPMPKAHVHLVKPNYLAPFLTVPVEEDGRYVIDTDATGPFFVQYSGVHHRDLRVLLGTDQAVDERIAVRLATQKLDEQVYRVEIFSDANGFSLSTDALEMPRLPDGTFQITFPSDAQTFAYLLRINQNRRNSGTQGVDYRHFINHMDLGLSIFDSGYRAVVKPQGGKVTISFDPEHVPSSIAPSSVVFENPDSPLARANALYQAYTMHRVASEGAIGALADAGIDEQRHVFDLSTAIEQLPRRHFGADSIADAQVPARLRQLVLLTQLRLATLNVPRDPQRVAELTDRVVSGVDPGAYMLQVYPRAILAMHDVHIDASINDAALKQRCKQFLEAMAARQSDKVKIKLLAYASYQAVARGDEEARQHWVGLFAEQFRDSDDAGVKGMIAGYSRPVVVGVGKAAPEFSLQSMEDPEVTYTNASFKGRKYLLDFWAVWCVPCVAELPGLHRMYEKYKSRGLEVLSVSFDRAQEEVTRFRARKWPMPWHHAFVENGLSSPIAKKFRVQGIPKPILIDGDTGTILAMEGELRGENLERTLEKFLR